MSKRFVYRFTNRRTVRNTIRGLRRNFPDKDRFEVGVVVLENEEILVHLVLRGRWAMHKEIFVQGILHGGKEEEMTREEFSKAALEAPETYLGSAALAFPISRPGERPGGPHGG